MHNLRIPKNKTIKICSTCELVFVCPRLFRILDHDIISVLVALRFGLAAPNLWTAALCLTSNTSENWWVYFLALGFFTGTYMLSEIVLLSAGHSGVETIAASIIDLYFC